MGQYHKPVNLDKQEFLNPHAFGDGLKLMEFGTSSHGTLAALAGMLLLDVQQVGPWAGCRLTVTGDYGDEGRFVPAEFAEHNLYTLLCGDLGDEDEEDSDVEGSEADGGTLDGSMLAKPAKPQAPRYTELREECSRQLAGLGIPMEFSTLQGGSIPGLENLERVYDQPEDLFEGLDVSPRENSLLTLGDCLTQIRCSRHANPLSWLRVEDVEYELEVSTGRIVQMCVRFSNERNESSFPRRLSKVLAFPASTTSVREFFQVTSIAPALLTNQTGDSPATPL